MKTLLLFDLDGTLIQTSAGRVATERAFERLYGIKNAAANVLMAGRTDPIIFQEICGALHLDPSTFPDWNAVYLEELAAQLKIEPGCVLPGVVALLESLSRNPDFVLALGTGNVEEGARLKLAEHDLNRFFAVGGYGTDGATRDDVIQAGIKKAEAHYGGKFDRIIVLGDTPMDISCGKANCCIAVGVATGRYSVADLAGCGADLVLPSLADTAAVIAALQAPHV